VNTKKLAQLFRQMAAVQQAIAAEFEKVGEEPAPSKPRRTKRLLASDAPANDAHPPAPRNALLEARAEAALRKAGIPV
jgi:hypothetical protein